MLDPLRPLLTRDFSGRNVILSHPHRRWTGVPDDNDVDDYCDKCGSVIAWGSVKTVVKSSQSPDQVLCESCTEAAHREFWDGP